MKKNPAELRTVLVTDCGSTTTKALLFERTETGWRQSFRGEAPTTVEAPVADVTVGALNAFQEIEELSGRKILSHDTSAVHPFTLTTTNPAEGIDLYLSTSSAGGGLQMVVSGLVGEMSAQSAQRAALGAGAIVLDVISADDGRPDHERIKRLRHLRPDIVLLTGGVDGGPKAPVLEVAEILLSSSPRARFGDTLKLPVIYAGNNQAGHDVAELLKNFAQVSIVPNVRPTIERENLPPAREAIHEIFLSHVMSHSPGYGKLLSWSPVPIMPTPSAVGDVVKEYATGAGKNVLAVDIGGATTDVFSVIKNGEGAYVFNRTVSANLGMSYSVGQVLLEAGAENIARWLSYDIPLGEIRDRLRNKMIRPTSIPQTKEDLWLEQAVCREALRLSLRHHRSLAVGLSGAQRRRGISDIFSQSSSSSETFDRRSLDLVIGSGGVLSHAPSRLAAGLMMIDGFELVGVTELAVDSVFMMPHLGVLASVHPEAAREIFARDCLVPIGVSIAATFSARAPQKLARVLIDGAPVAELLRGDIKHHAIPEMANEVELTAEPLHRSVDCGAGPGIPRKRRVRIGSGGLFLDGRGGRSHLLAIHKREPANRRSS